MLVLLQGKTLTPGDLGIAVRQANGALMDPAVITYTIFSVDDQGLQTLATAPQLIPQRSGLGTYFVNMTIPTVWKGRFELVWYLTQFPGGAEDTVHEEFEVTQIDPATTSFEAPSVLIAQRPGMSKLMAERIMRVRELLSDENPDRNYHFRPPTQGTTVAGFNSRVGYIWTDSTIIGMLRFAIQQINTANPMNLYHFTVESAPPAWAEACCLGAAVRCLSKEAARWAEEGGWSYSLNGVSLGIDKAAQYQSLADSLRSEFNDWLPNLTANRPYSAGLRQNRWLLG
jgi:hypothetical protein